MEVPRVRLRDGRFLAYKESGVPKHVAKFKVVVIHGLGSSRNALFPCSPSLMEEMGVYMVGFDRAGYGQSDAYPQRCVKSEAYDIEDLADELELGPRFHIIAISIGGYSAWSCLKHIPHRIAGAALIAPAINYWWPCLPRCLTRQMFNKRTFVDRCGLRIAHYAPRLHSLWETTRNILKINGISNLDKQDQVFLRILEDMEEQQHGGYESTNRDILVQFGNWGFDPSHIKQPHPNVKVEIWQGDKDYLVPAELQRYIHENILPWTGYYELHDMGHLFFLLAGRADEILRHLLSN